VTLYEAYIIKAYVSADYFLGDVTQSSDSRLSETNLAKRD